MTPDEIVKDLHDADLCDDTEKYRLCIKAADLIESLQSQLADYHHMSELVDGKMAENQRLRGINENLQSQLVASKRREQAAVVDLSTYKDCGFCTHLQDQQYCYKNCQRHVDVDNFRTHPCWQWRGPQEAGKGDSSCIKHRES